MVGAVSAAASNQTAGESGGICQLAGKDYNGGLLPALSSKALMVKLIKTKIKHSAWMSFSTT